MQSLSQPSRTAWRWMLPLVMLALAALACDAGHVLMPLVKQVQADPQQPGRAYALIGGLDNNREIVYQTDDYGDHWARSKAGFPEDRAENVSYPLEMRGEGLYFGDRMVWAFPRSQFRFFFFDSSSSAGNRFNLPYGGQVNNSAQGDTVYVAMGTEGVLVGRMADLPRLADARLGHVGMDALNPLPLTIRQPATIATIVLAGLLIPPYALMHVYLLSRVWGYALPRSHARRSGLLTTLILSAGAAAGVVIWLTDVRTDYYPMVAAVTGFGVVLSLTQAVFIAREAGLSPYARSRLLIASALVSLIVPLGVAGIFTTWWLVYALVFGYFRYQRVYARHLTLPVDGGDDRHLRWLIDRLSLETLVIALVGAAAAIFGGYIALVMVNTTRTPLGYLYQWVPFAIPIGAIGVGWLLIRRHVNRRLGGLIKEKRAEGETQPPLSRIQRDLRVATLVSMLSVIGASVVTFMLQAMAYNWFTTLLIR